MSVRILGPRAGADGRLDRSRSLSAQAQGTGIREVSASARSLIPLQTRLRYTTMVVLPEGEEILDVICGDKDFWVISSTHNIAHVKPAKEGAATNMNLVTASGAVYSFLLTEKGGTGMPDLKVYVNADPNAPQGKPKYYSAAQVENLQGELAEAKAQVEAANRRAIESIATYQQQYPAKLQFVYGSPKYEKPFLVRSIWNDGQFTYIKADATRAAGALRGEGREAGLAQLPGARGHVRRAESARQGLPGARQGALRILAAGAVMYGRHSFCREHRARPAAGDRRRPPSCSTRRSAARCPDLGDGGRRRWHAGDHADRRTSRSSGAASDDDGASAGSERRSRAGLSGPAANARSASNARCAGDHADAERPAGAIRRHAASAAARSDRRRSEAA